MNYLEADNRATISSGVTINATGDLAVVAKAEVDASAQALSTSTNTESDNGVAAAVGLNIVLASNKGEVGDSTDLTAGSVAVRAIMPAEDAANTFESRALAGCDFKGQRNRRFDFCQFP